MNRQQRRALRHDHEPAPTRIPGGCPDCDAYQQIDTSQAPLILLRVFHDDSCPAYLRRDRA